MVFRRDKVAGVHLLFEWVSRRSCMEQETTPDTSCDGRFFVRSTVAECRRDECAPWSEGNVKGALADGESKTTHVVTTRSQGQAKT